MLPISTVLRMLRIALGYGSRTERIKRLLNSSDPDVAMTTRSWVIQGLISEEHATVVVK